MQFFKQIRYISSYTLRTNNQNVFLCQVRSKHVINRKPMNKFVPSFKISANETGNDFDEAETIRPVEDENLKSDYLPPGYKITDFPKYQRIQGFDKRNPILKKLQKEFREASGQKVIPKVKDDTSGKQQSNTILVEGKRLIQDAMNSGFYPKTFVFSRVNQLVDFKFDKSKEMNMYQIPYRSVELWSEMPVGHPGFMAIFDKQEIETELISRTNAEHLPITMILENIRNPDIIGALTRVAASFGCKKIITIKGGCADIWNPKSIRAGAGGHFKIPIASGIPWQNIPSMIPHHAQLLLVDNSTESSIISDNGNYTEKLNQLVQKCKAFRMDGGEDHSFFETEILEDYGSLPLETYKWNQLGGQLNNTSETFIMFSGESQGSTLMAVKLAHERNGAKIQIPLKNQMGSLNAACAASILLCQIQMNVENTTLS